MGITSVIIRVKHKIFNKIWSPANWNLLKCGKPFLFIQPHIFIITKRNKGIWQKIYSISLEATLKLYHRSWRCLATSFSEWSFGFSLRMGLVGFVVEKMGSGAVCRLRTVASCCHTSFYQCCLLRGWCSSPFWDCSTRRLIPLIYLQIKLSATSAGVAVNLNIFSWL